MKRLFGKLVLFGLLWMLAFAALGGEPGASKSDLVYGRAISLYGGAIESDAALAIAGRGIPLPGDVTGSALYDAHGREVVWREVQRRVDPSGGAHIVYHQFLLGDVAAEIVGSEMGVHYDADGSLSLISGNQFDAVMVTNVPQIASDEAADRASRTMRTFARLRSDTVSSLRKDATLQVVAQRNGEFRYVWKTGAIDDNGAEWSVLVDAQSARPVVAMTHRLSNCGPSYPNAWETAIIRPSHPNWGPFEEKEGQATPIGDQFQWYSTSSYWAPFTHEAVWTGGQTNVPNVVVYQQIGNGSISDPNTSPYKCQAGEGYSYSLVPLRGDPFTTGSNEPIYENDHGWLGRIAGDALRFSRETMLAFASLNRNGWDGAGSQASVVIDSTLAAPDTGVFLSPNEGGPRMPSNGGVAITQKLEYYSLATSLDAIAHEWGHGVNEHRSGGTAFPYTGVGGHMDEGWADVIGTIVEKFRQPAGNGLEQSSDWTMHEDSGAGGYARGALDDGSGGTGHSWAKATPLPNTPAYRSINDRIHKDDYGFDATFHASGNMLVMAMKLLAEGGVNPICSRPGTNPYTGLPFSQSIGCSTPVTAQGVYNAANIMWQALINYVPSTEAWETVGNHVMFAAFQRHKQCGSGNNALAQQTAVYRAFANIGYPPTVPFYTCP